MSEEKDMSNGIWDDGKFVLQSTRENRMKEYENIKECSEDWAKYADKLKEHIDYLEDRLFDHGIPFNKI